MKNKTLIKILWISSVVIFIFTIGAYILNFGAFNISDSPENWAQFGDYVGGLINPLISILNLIILTYLSLRLVKNDDDRNKWTLMELARPYGELDFDKNKGVVQIRILSVGLGPMIIKEIKIINQDGKVYTDFDHLIDGLDRIADFSLKTFSFSQNHCAISKDSELVIFKVSGDLNSPEYVITLNNLIEALNCYSIEVNYGDMYGREIGNIFDEVVFVHPIIESEWALHNKA